MLPTLAGDFLLTVDFRKNIPYNEFVSNFHIKGGHTIINWIITIGSNPLVSSLSSLCGIAGLVFSVAIWAKTKDLRDQINVYKQNQQEIVTRLMAHRDSICKDGLYTMDIRSHIRAELYSILQDYSALLSIWVKLKIHLAIHLMNSNRDYADLEKLCSLLDWIIARIQRKENR